MSHFCELIKIDNDLERQFYEKECIAQKCNGRTLKKQKDMALFLRLATKRIRKEFWNLPTMV